MSDSSQVIQRVQDRLQPFVKPREQSNYIRRILALHLGYSSQGSPLSLPLALETNSHDPNAETNSTGLCKEYLDALSANVAARRRFEDAAHATSQGVDEAMRPQSADRPIIQNHVALLKLQRSLRRLSSIQRHMDTLSDQPPAMTSILNTDQIFDGATTLPHIPKEVVNSLVAENTSTGRNLASQVNDLEKTVLRAKIQFQREGRQLESTKARKASTRSKSNNAAKLDALNATRNELIGWIERELSMVPSEEPDDQRDESGANVGIMPEPAAITTALGDIKQKYDRYVSMRSDLLSLMSQQAHSLAAPPELKPNMTTQSPKPSPSPSNYLLTPYIERLLEVSKEQKATISHKSHMNTLLGKQTKDACQALGHLAEESQMLPAHPMKDSLRRRSGLINEFTTKRSELPDLSSRVGPWIFAADSAKIANLESVAETVETGQLAIENSMAALDEIKRLVGLRQDQKEDAKEEKVEDDMWMGAEKGRSTHTRKHSQQKLGPDKKNGDIWSVLQGNLGLIGQEDLA